MKAGALGRAAATLLLAGCGAAPSAGLDVSGLPEAEPAAARGPFLMAYFIGDGEDGLHLASSSDALSWQPLIGARPVLRPAVARERVLRDPSLLRGPDGLFHLVWTASGDEPVIGYARSTDLVSWSEQRALPVMAGETGAKNAWAPKIFYDRLERRFMVTWSSTVQGRFTGSESSAEPGFNHRIYYTTTTDFERLAPSRLLYDPGFTVIDAVIARDGPRYLMFVKDERRNPWRKQLVVATARSPEGPWGSPSAPITGNYPAEGPAPIKIGRTWFVFFEKHAEHKLGLVISQNLVDWNDVSGLLRAPPRARHGSVISVPEDVVAQLQQIQ